MITLLAIVIILGSVTYLALPLLFVDTNRLHWNGTMNSDLENLLDHRDNLLITIKDLEFDQQLGKISKSDYLELDASYREQTVNLLRQIEAAELSADNPRMGDNFDGVAGDHGDEGSASSCDNCGTALADDDHYCYHCGQKII